MNLNWKNYYGAFFSAKKLCDYFFMVITFPINISTLLKLVNNFSTYYISILVCL